MIKRVGLKNLMMFWEIFQKNFGISDLQHRLCIGNMYSIEFDMYSIEFSKFNFTKIFSSSNILSRHSEKKSFKNRIAI